MRRQIRTLVEGSLVAAGVDRLASRGRAGRTLILMYHNVIDQKEGAVGTPGAHLGLDDFRRQLDHLQSTGTIVPLAQALDPPEGDAIRFVITFDDAYRGAVRLALPELLERGIPGTMFVPPGLLGSDGFWWDRLPLSGWETPEPFGELQGKGDAVRAWARARGMKERDVPPDQKASGEDELRHHLSGSTIALGCHSWDHPNLASLPVAEVEKQLRRSLQWLRDSGSNWIPWVSYPYGLYSPGVGRIAARVGLAGGVRASGGWVSRSPVDTFDVPRANVPAGLSMNGFRLLTSGLHRG